MKKTFGILLLSILTQWVWAQSGEGYDPQNPGDPEACYRLMIEASPLIGGIVYPERQNLATGKTIWVIAEPRLGYTFKQWMDGDKVISAEKEFQYTMPSNDVVLTAYFDYVGSEGYDPENPGDPMADGYQHKVTLYATPSVGGHFNSSSFYLTEGKTTNVYAYPRNGYRFVSWKQNGKIVSTSNPMELTMGTENQEYTAQFVYDPVSPDNPGANNFNATTGELVIDDFEPSRLSSAINTTLGTDDNYNKVKSITIIGVMHADDFGFLKGMTNCSVADLSRTTGYNNVPDYSFEGASALKTLILPYSVESIGERAFSGCSNLSILYCYATTPPSVSGTSFDDVPTSMKVLVPALSLELYQRANGWKDFFLSALDGVTNTLTISLPEDAKDGRYKNMILELDNINSGQVSRMLITDRTRYSFFNLIHNTKYNVYVKTAKSVVLGEIQNVEIVDKDVDTAFVQLKQPQTVIMSVINDKGENLTESTDVTWFDENGNYLTTGNTIAGFVDGTVLKYRVKLSNDAALYYVAPQDSTYKIRAAGNEFNCILTPLQLVTVTGYVKNANTKKGIYDASVSISQQTSGKQSRTIVAKTDVNGMFTAEVYNSPASISCAAFDYVNKSLGVESFNVTDSKVTMDDIMLNSIVGATVNISHTYQESVLEGETPDVQDWYSDYQNLALSVFNVTTNQEVTQISNRYPQFVLMDGVRVGDELRLTLSSKKSVFTPIVIEKKVDETEEINALFAIKQYGGMHASYQTTTNDAVVGMLFDENGYLLQRGEFSKDKMISFNELKDGDYTIIMMGKNDSYNSIYNIKRFRDAGLTENVDYYKSNVTIVSGIIKNIDIANVPYLNIAKFQTIDKEKSSLSVNKSSIVAGNYLTFTGVVALQDENLVITDDMSLVVDIPTSASFVKGSVMVDDKVVDNYTFADNTLTIPFNNIGQQNKIKFCVIPTAEGTYQPNAMVGFKANGEIVMIPLQSNDFVVKAISINVPLKTSREDIYVSGTAVQGSLVEVYDDETLIGTSKVDKTGEWSIKCLLEKPYNLSYHNIYAISNTENVKLTSSVEKCWYDRSAITAKTVAMSFYNTWLYGGSTVEVLFDLENNKITNPHYMFYQDAEFSFAADLTNNDPSVVESVIVRVYTKENKWVNINTQYDAKLNRWIGRHQFGWANVPVAVSVNVNTNSNYQPLIDEQQITDTRYDVATISSEMSDAIRRIEELSDSLMTPDEYEILLADITNENIDKHDGLTYEYLESLSDAELDELISQFEDGEIEDSLYLSIDFYKNFFNASPYFEKTLPDSTIIKSVFCDNVNRDSLVASGFAEYLTTEGQIFFKETNYQSEFIDVQQKLHIILYRNAQIRDSESSRARRAATGIDAFNEIMEEINRFYQPIANAYVETEEKLHVFSQYFENQASMIKAELPKARTRFYTKEIKLKRLEQELTKTTNLTDYLAKQREIESYKIQVDKAKFTLNNLNTRLFLAKKAFSAAKFLPKLFKKSIPLTKYGDIIADGLTVVRTFQKAYLSIPDPCKDDEEKAQLCKELCIASAMYCEEYVALKAGASAALDLATVGQLAAAPETGGVTAAGALGTMILNISANLVVDYLISIHNKAVEKQIHEIISDLKCVDKCPICQKKPCECCNICGKYPCECEPSLQTDPQHDPSGYVYEGIFNNRIEGVTATCYHKILVEDMYGDLHDNIVKWDAEEYGQENPLHTDKDGFYQWFVPEGLWQVKYEKEGYETAYSEWLPVPPPQLDVNIGIVQKRQPEVKEAHAYEDGVELSFDKYMLPASLTTENIRVSQNGQFVEGTIILLDEEVAYRDENVKYASRVRFIPDSAFNASREITLIVDKKVKSYAGIQMQGTYTQSFDVEPEISEIHVAPIIQVLCEDSVGIVVGVTPSEAANGKTLIVKSASDMIASVNESSTVIDERGEAVVTITGGLPGTTALTFTIDGYNISATSVVRVVTEFADAPEAPTASIASGATVANGTTIALTCATKGVTIYYTTDGSCPCDEARRFMYTEPIVIDKTVTIKAISVAPDMTESEIVEFFYIVDEQDGIDEVTLDADIMVYPLPVRDKLNVTADNKVIKSVALTSMDGSTIVRATKPATMITLDASSLESGIYIINVTTTEKTYSRKIIKVN